MPWTGLKKRLSPIVRKTGLLPCLQIVRGHGLRLARSCRRRFCNRNGQTEKAVPSRLYTMSADGLPTWFGYYDKTPFSQDNSRVLAMAMTYTKDWSPKAADLPVKLGIFAWADVVAGKPAFRRFAETRTWSWQQGCMLQWFPRDPDRLVLYNRLIEGRYGSVIQDVFTRDIVKSYQMPVYAIDPVGRWGVSLNFSRLERLRPGYGYTNLPDETQADPCPDSDGIWRLDLESGESQMLLSLREMADFKPLPSMADGPHYVNHLLYSPDGTRVVFLHLWTSDGCRRNRLMLYDFADSSLHVLDDAAIVSHFNWLADDQLLCFRVPHEGNPGYYVYTLARDHTARCAPMGPGLPSQDGHPSLSPSGDLIVTDTYPDRTGDQLLCVYSMREKTLREVGRFFSPFRYRGPLRCDLHPRWDRTGTRICFDSAHRTKRAICVLDLHVDQDMGREG